MSARHHIKHNPGFLEDDVLEASFVVRGAELETVCGIVNDNTGPANQHVAIIGARGMGKSTLVHRSALAARTRPELRDLWHPIVVAEELYEVSSEAELWLAVLRTGAHGIDDADGRWRDICADLLSERDDARLRVRAINALREFAESLSKRLLVCIENLQMLLGEQMTSNAGWDLRGTLQNVPEIMLLVTATTRFEEITSPASANYDLFREIQLRPLDTDACRTLWTHVAGEKLEGLRIRPMEILSGGNPRLLTILGTFAAGMAFDTLLDNLVQLVDDHTPFLKSNIDALPAQERRVFVALARIWQPATAREVAERIRLDVNKTSAVLGSLMGRGAVVQVGQEGRARLYEVSERMYCIYLMMRQAGSESERVRALIRFMVPLYGEERVVGALAQFACDGDALVRADRVRVVADLINEVLDIVPRDRVAAALPAEFLELPEAMGVRARLAAAVDEDLTVEDVGARLSMARRLLPDVMDVHGPLIRLALVASVAWRLGRRGRIAEALGHLDGERHLLEACDASTGVPQFVRHLSALLRIVGGVGSIELARSDADAMSEGARSGIDDALLAGLVSATERRWDDARAALAGCVQLVGEGSETSAMLKLLLIDFAAEGLAADALAVVDGTSVATELEPLVVALKREAGVKYRAPREVEQVADDLVARIAARRRELPEVRRRMGVPDAPP